MRESRRRTGAEARNPCEDSTRPWKGRSSTVVAKITFSRATYSSEEMKKTLKRSGRSALCPLRLRQDSEAAAIDGFEDSIATAGQEGGTGGVAELFGIVSVARVAEELGAVGVGDDGFEMQLAISHFGEVADGNLATSTETVEQGALAGGGGAGGGVVQECEMVASGGIAETDFDAKRALSGGGAHDFGGDDLLDQLRFAEAFESGGGEDDGVVFSLLEFAEARVDVAAQRMNVEIGADGFELR